MLKNIIGAIVFTVAVLALVNFVGDMMVNPRVAVQDPEPVEAETTADQQEVDVAPEAAVEAVDEAEDVASAASALAEDGKAIFKRKCATCHTADKGGKNRIGPNLWGVVGREKASMEGFRYSTSMQTKGGTWTEDDLHALIAAPRNFVPDTKMMFAGIQDEEDRDAVIAYLETLSD